MGVLSDMESQLGWSGIAGAGAGVRVTEPVFLADPMQVAAGVEITDEFGVLGTGSISVILDSARREARVSILITEGETTRWLELVMYGFSGGLVVQGVMSFDDGSELSGGWIYSSVSGAVVETPGSDAGFAASVSDMLHTGPAGFSAAVGFSLGDGINLIGNITSLIIHYLLDSFIPYTAPTSCTGPTLASTCDPGDVPCQDQISGLCESSIDAIPDVSDAFKKCMKGRCGCGGSTFPTIRLTCAESSDCGPCGGFGDPGGCNIGGQTEWYCDPTTDDC